MSPFSGMITLNRNSLRRLKKNSNKKKPNEEEEDCSITSSSSSRSSINSSKWSDLDSSHRSNSSNISSRNKSNQEKGSLSTYEFSYVHSPIYISEVESDDDDSTANNIMAALLRDDDDDDDVNDDDDNNDDVDEEQEQQQQLPSPMASVSRSELLQELMKQNEEVSKMIRSTQQQTDNDNDHDNNDSDTAVNITSKIDVILSIQDHINKTIGVLVCDLLLLHDTTTTTTNNNSNNNHALSAPPVVPVQPQPHLEETTAAATAAVVTTTPTRSAADATSSINNTNTVDIGTATKNSSPMTSTSSTSSNSSSNDSDRDRDREMEADHRGENTDCNKEVDADAKLSSATKQEKYNTMKKKSFTKEAAQERKAYKTKVKHLVFDEEEEQRMQHTKDPQKISEIYHAAAAEAVQRARDYALRDELTAQRIYTTIPTTDVSKEATTPQSKTNNKNNIHDSNNSHNTDNNNDTTNNESSNNNNLKVASSSLQVQFSTIDIREYDLCLGDNPAVSKGAPISLDWDYKKEVSYPLEEYERDQQQQQQQSQSQSLDESSSSNSSTSSSSSSSSSSGKEERKKMFRPSLERLDLLKELGYSRSEIQEATIMVEKIQKQRSKSLKESSRKGGSSRNKNLNNMRSFFLNKYTKKARMIINRTIQEDVSPGYSYE